MTSTLGGATLDGLKLTVMSLWKKLAGLGLTVYQTTLIPRNVSTDAWQSLGGQKSVDGTAEMEMIRQRFNLWLRAPRSAGKGASALFDSEGSLAGVIDTGRTLEVNRDGSAIQIDGVDGSIANGNGGYFKIEDQDFYVGVTVGSGIVSSSWSSTRVVIDSAAHWKSGEWKDYTLYLDSVSGMQIAPIVGNTDNLLVLGTSLHLPAEDGLHYRIRKLYSRDGVHPTAFGHTSMATAIDKSLFVGR